MAERNFVDGKTSSSSVNGVVNQMARFKQGAIGDNGLNVINGRVYEEMNCDLVFPQSIQTYNRMLYDASISSAKDLFETMIRRVPIYAHSPDPNNEEAVKNAEFINWMFDNLDDQTFRQVKQELLTYDWAGFSLLEKVFETIKEGDYEGLMRVKSFQPRPQSSIDRWLWSDDGRTLKGVRQKVSNSRLASDGFITSSTVDIPLSKLCLFSYNSTKNNPEGKSPLAKTYVTWKFKCLIEDYEATGIAKDMSGMPVFDVPKDVLVKAQNDPNSAEGILVQYMETQAANMHAGEQMYVLNPVEYHETGKPLFGFKLLGVEGGSKNYNVDDVIKRRQNEILMAYFCDLLRLGSDGAGSFALADSKTSILAMAIEDHMQFITSVLQEQCIKQLANMNGWSKADTPVLTYGDIEDRDLDIFSKAIQRIGAVNFLPRTQKVVSWVAKNMGYEDWKEFAEMEDGDFDKLFTDNENKVGKGLESGMPNGTGDSNSADDSSTSNNENT